MDEVKLICCGRCALSVLATSRRHSPWRTKVHARTSKLRDLRAASRCAHRLMISDEGPSHSNTRVDNATERTISTVAWRRMRRAVRREQHCAQWRAANLTAPAADSIRHIIVHSSCSRRDRTCTVTAIPWENLSCRSCCSLGKQTNYSIDFVLTYTIQSLFRLRTAAADQRIPGWLFRHCLRLLEWHNRSDRRQQRKWE